MKSFIIDIDGTVLNGNLEVNKSSQYIEYLQKEGIDFLLATNSIKSHALQVERFRKIGVRITPEMIYNPIDSINKYIEDNQIKSVFIVGSEHESSQIKVEQSATSPDLILLLDFEKCNFSYNDLQVIIDYIENGSRIISASGSPYYLKNGKKQLDTGAFVQLIESVTEKKIPVLGKPSKAFFLNAQKTLKSQMENTFVIGDDWKTDILGAEHVGFRTVLVKSGKYTQGDESYCKPDLVTDNLMDLISQLKG